MNVASLAVVSTITCLFAFAPRSFAESAGAPKTAVEASQLVLQGIRENNDRLEGLELEIVSDGIDKSVPEESTTETKTPDGGMVRVTLKPAIHAVNRVVMFNDRIRADYGSGESRPLTVWFDGYRWTEIDASSRKATRKFSDQMGGMAPVDPREVVGLELKHPLSLLLAEPAMATASFATEGTLTVITTATPGGQKLIIDFDAAKSFLPVRSRLFHPDGSLFVDSRISYQSVPGRSALAPLEIRQLNYLPSPTPRNDDDWTLQMVRRVTSAVPISREQAEKALAVEIPTGFRFLDYTDSKTFEVQKRPARAVAAEDHSPVRWLIVLNVILLGAYGGYWWWQRRRSPATGIKV